MKKWRCVICGEIFEGEAAPNPCPVCGAPGSLMEEVPAGDAPLPDGVLQKWRCTVCGEVLEGDVPPTHCPVCNAPSPLFEAADPGGDTTVAENMAAGTSAAANGARRWRCTVCGAEFDGPTPPDPCPVCGAAAALFVEVVAQATQPAAAAQSTGVAATMEQPATETIKWRCTVCGQVFEGDAPPVPCPVCSAGAEAFERLGPGAAAQRRDTEEDFVLVGGGVAAVAAARAIRKRNQTARVTLVAGEPYHPYNRPSLSNVVASGLPFEQILLEQPGFYQENRIELLCGNPAVHIDAAAGTVQLADGAKLPYNKLLLATGANPFNPLKSEPGAIPVKVLRSFAHATELIEQVSGKRVVLAGGGILGLEAAMALRGRGCAVTVVEIAPRILPLQTDEEASRMLAEALAANGLALLTNASVASVVPGGVLLGDGRRVDADVVLASMGVRSEVTLAKELGLTIGRGIAVDAFMHTSLPGIWAAGDCAEYNGAVLAIAGAAASMGEAAGASMCGDESEPYQPFTPATAFSCPGFSLFRVGAVNEDTGETAVYRSGQNIYKRLFFTEGALTGVLFVNAPGGATAVSAVGSRLPLKEAVALLG